MSRPSPVSPPRFVVERGPALIVRGPGGRTLERPRPAPVHDDWLDFHAAFAATFGTRTPAARETRAPPTFQAPFRALLTEAVSPEITDGYGDPSVLFVADGPDRGWWLTVTSNDAPQSFPILYSPDSVGWRAAGFVFPAGRKPEWALDGAGVADFWAPELHRVGGACWLLYSARARDRSLAVGLARAERPGGPYRADPEPLVGGGVIDPHLVTARDGSPWLVWKEDSNGVWPRVLGALLADRPELIPDLFPHEPDQATAALACALRPLIVAMEPMEQFFALQPLIEAAADDFPAFQDRLRRLRDRLGPPARGLAARALEAVRTRIRAQRLAADGSRLEGEPVTILENDLSWEAHLIEGVWIVEHAGRWWLFYAANDFSTDRYGVGAAVADDPLGPYAKQEEPFLRSTADWSGPGHPSVAPGPDGRPTMYLHAFRPGRTGYKAFRALLSVGLAFEGDRVRLCAP